MTEFASARTVGELRAVLAGLPDRLPVVLDGRGALDVLQVGEEHADVVRRSGFVDNVSEDDRPVAVLWLLGEKRD